MPYPPFPHHPSRRRLLAALAAGGAAPLFGALPARAQDFPTRPITVVVAQAAGGGSDTLTRLWADYVARVLGQPVVVDNRPGAAGVVAAQAVLQRPADGYTLFSAGTSSIIINKFTMKSLPYDGKDFRGIAMLATFSYLLLASPGSGIRNFDDLVRLARERPGKIHFGSGGVGNGSHLMLELLQKEAGIRLNHVPYKGELPYMTALLADEVQVVIASIGVSLPHVLAGKAVPLAVMGDKPLPELPQVPVASRVGVKGFEGLFWAAILARAGTPDAVTRRLHAASQQFLSDPEVVKKLEKLQSAPAPGPVDAYETVLAAETRKWTEVTRGLNIIMD